MRGILTILALVLGPCSMRLSAQGLSTTRLESTINEPLIIAQRSPVGQPIRFLTGSNGSVPALELDPQGTALLRRAVFLQQGLPASTGLLVRDIGLSGTEHAGIVLQSNLNGTGTGIRIGGPTGGPRPTLGTGIDITGGTGLRYNALTGGSGTAIEIGSTVAPRRGIEITTAGTDHVGVYSVANSSGTGLVGVARSASYTPPAPRPGTGVYGFGVTNSTVAADTIVGIAGTAQRGGAGGTMTTSIGCIGRADASGTSHAGTAIGVLGTAQAIAPGRASAIGGLFHVPTDHIALATFGGDVYLGSTDDERPNVLRASTAASLSGQTTTHMYNATVSGLLRTRGLALRSGDRHAALAGLNNDVPTHDLTVLRVDGDAVQSTITGLSDVHPDRFLILIVTAGVVVLAHEHPASQAEHRLLLPGAVERRLEVNEHIFLWFDNEVQRWRVL